LLILRIVKERVTLTLDRTVTHRGKSAARARGTSLSGLVESLLAEATGSRKSAGKDFVTKWAGKFEVADLKGSRGEYLRHKYGL
jgi:hypothetical protein